MAKGYKTKAEIGQLIDDVAEDDNQTISGSEKLTAKELEGSFEIDISGSDKSLEINDKKMIEDRKGMIAVRVLSPAALARRGENSGKK